MEDLGLKTLADFDGIGVAEVEAHLPDLAVDGNVAFHSRGICDLRILTGQLALFR